MTDLDRSWGDFKLRIKGRAPIASQGQAIISTGLLLRHGIPLFWTKPQVLMIEPRSVNIAVFFGSASNPFAWWTPSHTQDAWDELIDAIRKYVGIEQQPDRLVYAGIQIVVCEGEPVHCTEPCLRVRESNVFATVEDLTEFLSYQVVD